MNPTILLHPNIPKPLHGIAPRLILGWRWWDKVRYQAYKKHGFCCHACGIPVYKAKYKNILEAHECYKIDYGKATMLYLETVALCHSCHSYIHSGRLEMLLLDGKITVSRYNDIMAHGRKVLECTVCSNPYIVNNLLDLSSNWSDWRLVLMDKKYPGKFENYETWFDHYAKGGE